MFQLVELSESLKQSSILPVLKGLISFFKMQRDYNGYNYHTFKPIQDGGGQKRPPTRFSPVTSTNVGITSQNLLTFSFNPFATLT